MQTKANYEIQKEKKLYLVLGLRDESEHDRWQRDDQDLEHLQHSEHEHWHVSAQFSCLLVKFVSSWFTHCTAWLKGVTYFISSIREVCGSPSTLSPPFRFTSSSSHSSFINCIFFCISSTLLKTAGSLCTPPNRICTLFTTPTPSQIVIPTITTSRRLASSPTQSSWPRRRTSPSKGFPRTPSTMTPHSRICCVEAHRIHVHHFQREDLFVGQSSSASEKNVATCWRKSGTTCWFK